MDVINPPAAYETWTYASRTLTDPDGIVPAASENVANQTTLTGGAGPAKGAYVQLDAATAKEVIGLLLQFENASQAGAYLVDIATGAAASEADLIDDIVIVYADATLVTMYVPMNIATGVRLSARCQGPVGADTIDITCTICTKA